MTFTYNEIKNKFDLTKEGLEVLDLDFSKIDKILYAIEEINHSYILVDTGINKYPKPENTICELYIIVERNNEYILNYYYKEDKGYKTKYKLELFINIQELEKNNKLISFLKNYANFNDDKVLKSIVSKKKKLKHF
jgi:hypothetical protein